MTWTASDMLIDFVLSHTIPGETILELGSGESTRKFISSGRKVITVEHDPTFMGKVDGAEYILAPIKNYDDHYHQLPSVKKRAPHTGWYNPDILAEALRGKHYDIILVDGPLGVIGRSGFLQHLNIFPNLECPIVFDDQHRMDDLFVAECVARHLKRDYHITNNGLDTQPFGYILP